MRKTKRVYRFAHGCGSVRAEASRPGAMPARPEGDCIRNPRANWALRLHSCRALSSQPQTEANAPFKNAKVTKETCNPCARVLPMCQGESVTFVSEHSWTHETCMVPRFFALYRETKFFLESTFVPVCPTVFPPGSTFGSSHFLLVFAKFLGCSVSIFPQKIVYRFAKWLNCASCITGEVVP